MEPILPGLVPSQAYFIDERRRPDFRDVFGALSRRSAEILTAVTRVRLSTVDLTSEEMQPVRSFRVLLSEVSALTLDAEARSLLQIPRRATNVRLVTSLLESGRLQVRSAPLGGWSPDFSVFIGDGGPTAVIVGYHAFERPYPHRGPAWVSIHGGDSARLAADRHAELWAGAHDIGGVLWSLLARAQRRAALGHSG